ncbi:hypothetical protein VC279_17945 [Xanthomonas sp. WHRI 10064A]|uniref:hypothetical protein n=1 Tax=unclassified Xanthomonas TaxID=2643310 RepID=UPI002B233FC6|nr:MULTISPECIES: hypothetical protein [unclassified Xanthomonas]MEA9587326.1 hypothetical protein [Xanthomonas sp. WHRI 10064B]MEA9616518.1 hypothetical protein [Xanthomonas sp. WHRI 10064A]
MKSKKRESNRLVLPTVWVAGALALFGIAHASAVMPTPAPSATAAVSASDSYRPGQKWIVPGEWEFTVDSARVAKVKIPNHGGGSWLPTQVILLTYSYKNIGFDDSANYKDSGPSTLAFSKAHIDVSDANDADNGGAGNYPVRIKLVGDADGQTPGQEMLGAQWPYAFKKKVTAVKVTVSHYDSKLKLHEATFLVPVEGARQSTPHANRHVHHS